jgi:predicted TIM-barrel fold metal-dependent hydrolase
MIESPLTREFVQTGRCESCPIIDVHTHYGPYAGIYFPVHSGEALIRRLDRAGVRRILCAHHTALLDMRRGHDEIARVVRRWPGRVGAYVCYNPNYPDVAAEELKRLDSGDGFVGVKCHADTHEVRLTDERYAPAFEAASQRALPVLLHTWGLARWSGPELWAEIAQRYPRARFIMAHAGFGRWDEAVTCAARFENVFLGLSAAFTIPGVIEKAVAGCGPEKLLFGTDHPWFDIWFALGCVLFSRISDEARRMILFRNAERLLPAQR